MFKTGSFGRYPFSALNEVGTRDPCLEILIKLSPVNVPYTELQQDVKILFGGIVCLIPAIEDKFNYLPKRKFY
jgi:hypothetical protein